MAKRKITDWTPEAIRMGELFKGLIEEGWTQGRIAERLGIHQSYVSLLVNRRGIPRGVGAELVRLVFNEFKVNPWYFYDFPTDAVPDWHRYLIDTRRPPSAPPPERAQQTAVRRKSPR